MAAAKTTKKVEEVKPITEVLITLPRAHKGEENHITASVNGKVWRIQKGVPVKVPVEVAEVIENSVDAEIKAEAYIENKAY